MPPRVVKPAALRQDEILDIAERFFLERGYEATPIQAIIDAAGIAKGTFYHHYPSKSALLDAVVERHTARGMALVEALLADPALDAAQKLNALFLRGSAWKVEHRAVMIELHRALHQEGNAALYARMQHEGVARVVPIVAAVVAQGVAEGRFHTPWPRQAARLLVEMSTALGKLIGDALLDPAGPVPSAAELDAEIAATHDAVEKLLGAAPGTVQLFERAVLTQWLTPSEPR